MGGGGCGFGSWGSVGGRFRDGSRGYCWCGVAFLCAMAVVRTGRAGDCGREGGNEEGEGEKETKGRHKESGWKRRWAGRDGRTSSSLVGL